MEWLHATKFCKAAKSCNGWFASRFMRLLSPIVEKANELFMPQANLTFGYTNP
jgi:hypothetical protein